MAPVELSATPIAPVPDEAPAKEEVALSPAVEREPVVAPSAKSPDSAKPKQTEGDVKLPSGAAPNLHWELTGTELRLTPALAAGAQLTRAFVLTGPARAVFDISGPSPEKSHTMPSSPPYATAVRLGKQAGGTRIVIDLDNAPKRTSQSGSALVLSF